MHCITQISRLLFTSKHLKKKTSNRLGKPLEPTTKPKHMQVKIRRASQGCNRVEDKVWNIWISS